MLALEPGRTVSADRLAEGLWGDELPPSAAKMVQLYVSQLRRALDGDGVRIVTHGRGYELQLPSATSTPCASSGCWASRPRDALALWHGEGARRSRRRAVRGGRDPPARGAAAAGDGVAIDAERGWSPRRRDRRARRARGARAAARAPARRADARAVSQRPPVRSAGPPTRRRARRPGGRSGTARACVGRAGLAQRLLGHDRAELGEHLGWRPAARSASIACSSAPGVAPRGGGSRRPRTARRRRRRARPVPQRERLARLALRQQPLEVAGVDVRRRRPAARSRGRA